MHLSKLYVLSVIMLAFLTNCTNKNKSNTDLKVLNLNASNYVTLDPVISYDTASNDMLSQIYEGLYQYNFLKRPVEVEPLIAESMPEITNDGKTYKIKIKKGVKYHKGEYYKQGDRDEVQAQDFVYTFKRMAMPETKSPFIVFFQDFIVGLKDYKDKLTQEKDEVKRKALVATDIEGIKALDPYTLEIKLTKPVPHLIHFFTRVFTAPSNETFINRLGAIELNNKTIGTGPFIIKENVRKSKMVMVKNPDYREEYYPDYSNDEIKKRGLDKYAGKRLPFVDQINFYVHVESQPAWLKFKKGQLDTMGVPKDEFSNVITAGTLNKEFKDKGVEEFLIPMATHYYLQFNMNDDLLGKNLKLRKAIASAIDAATYNKKFLNDLGKVGTGIVPHGIFGTNDKKNPLVPEYNVEKAKQLLAEAGYPEGKGLPTIKYDLRTEASISRQIGEYIQSALKAVNINIKVVQNSFQAYLKKEKDGQDLQFTMGGWAADYPDAENFFQLLYSKNRSPGPNATNYNNSEFDKLYEKIAYSNMSKEQRLKTIKEAEDIALKDVVWVPMVYTAGYALKQAWVKNYNNSDFLENHLKYIDVDMKEKEKVLKEKF